MVNDGGNLGDPINITGVILVSIRKEVTNSHFGLKFITHSSIPYILKIVIYLIIKMIHFIVNI